MQYILRSGKKYISIVVHTSSSSVAVPGSRGSSSLLTDAACMVCGGII